MSMVRYWLGMAGAVLLALPVCAGTPDATTPRPSVADHSQPGSVIIIPKFVTGSVNVNPGTEDAFVAAKTVIELGALCPVGATCPADSTVIVHLEWICPGLALFAQPAVCSGSDFFVSLTYGNERAQKITFNPSGLTGPAPSDYNGNTQVTTPPCPRGYLIGWAVNSTGAPEVFNGLVGDAIMRSFGSDLQQETAITIQANGAEFSPVALGPNRGLVFDGAQGHYLAVTGQVTGDVNFDSVVNPPFHNQALIFLSLDIKAGQNNDPTFVPLNFYNFNEQELSTDTQFICWGQIELRQLSGFLTTEGMGTFGGTTRHDKGLVISGQAFDSILGQSVPRTLLGVIQTTEGPTGVITEATTSYITPFFNNSIAVPTVFGP